MSLRSIRVLKGYSQLSVAKALGYSNASSYRKIETGIQSLRVDQLILLSNFYGVAPSFLLKSSYPNRKERDKIL